MKIRGNTLKYWKENAEEDYIKVPISVLKYITILEELVAGDDKKDVNALLSKFDNGLELYQNNAIFANCFEHLLRGGDIYKIFEQIVVMQSNTQKKLTDLISSGTLRQEIIVSTERFEELLKFYKL